MQKRSKGCMRFFYYCMLLGILAQRSEIWFGQTLNFFLYQTSSKWLKIWYACTLRHAEMHAGLHAENSILHAVGYLSSKVWTHIGCFITDITVLIFLCVKFSPNDPKFGVEAFFGITNNPKGCMRQISRKKISALFSYTTELGKSQF